MLCSEFFFNDNVHIHSKQMEDKSTTSKYIVQSFFLFFAGMMEFYFIFFFLSFIEYDERNFHCWAYRYSLLQRLYSLSSDLELFYESELSFLRSAIGSNLSNYSAWHYRSKYLDKLLDYNPSRRFDLLFNEWQLVLSAVYTDCSDQAAWFYARWLLFKQLGNEFIHEDKHIQPLEELDQLEPGNKWCMLALCQLWKEKNINHQKRQNYLEELARQIDPDRAQFYRDQI